jgi:hypothetical protein
MVEFSPYQLAFTILFLTFSLLFSGGKLWVTRPGSIASKIVREGALAGAVVALYVPGSLSPLTWSASVAWIIILLSSSVISTAVVWPVAARVSGRIRRRVAGVAVGLVVGAATVATEVFLVHQVRPDLLTDPISSVLAIGAFAGALAGVLLEFNQR